MRYSFYDSSGNLLSGGIATVTGNTPSSGGSSVPVRNILKMGTFWSSSSGMPTSYRQMTEAIVVYNGGTAAVMNAAVTVNAAGYVNQIAGLINGPTTGACYYQLYKNGNPSGLIVSGTGSSGVTSLTQAGGSSYSFAQGDVLSVWLKGDQSSTNQSFSATIEVVYTA